MPTTTKLGLVTPAHRDLAWHTTLDTAFQRLDDLLTRQGTGSPNGVLTSDYLGQLYYDTTNNQIFVARTAAVNNAWYALTAPYYDTMANLAALTNVLDGATAWATDLKTLLIRSSGAWTPASDIGKMPAPSVVQGYTHIHMVANTWTEVVPSVSLVIPANIDGARHAVMVTGLVSMSYHTNGSGAPNWCMARIKKDNLPIVESGVPLWHNNWDQLYLTADYQGVTPGTTVVFKLELWAGGNGSVCRGYFTGAGYPFTDPIGGTCSLRVLLTPLDAV